MMRKSYMETQSNMWSTSQQQQWQSSWRFLDDLNPFVDELISIIDLVLPLRCTVLHGILNLRNTIVIIIAGLRVRREW